MINSIISSAKFFIGVAVNKTIFKFPTASNLEPEISDSVNNSNNVVEKQKDNQPEQQLAVDSYFNKSFDSIIINEVFKNWKK